METQPLLDSGLCASTLLLDSVAYILYMLAYTRIAYIYNMMIVYLFNPCLGSSLIHVLPTCNEARRNRDNKGHV